MTNRPFFRKSDRIIRRAKLAEELPVEETWRMVREGMARLEREKPMDYPSAHRSARNARKEAR